MDSILDQCEVCVCKCVTVNLDSCLIIWTSDEGALTILSFAISSFSYLKPGLARLANSSEGVFFNRLFYCRCGDCGEELTSERALQLSFNYASHPLERLNMRELSRVHLVVSTKDSWEIGKNWGAPLFRGCNSFRFYYWYSDALKSFYNISCRTVMGRG